jgi:hypothetical protein
MKDRVDVDHDRIRNSWRQLLQMLRRLRDGFDIIASLDTPRRNPTRIPGIRRVAGQYPTMVSHAAPKCFWGSSPNLPLQTRLSRTYNSLANSFHHVDPNSQPLKATMSSLPVARISPCCWRSLVAELRPQKQIRRSLVTLRPLPTQKIPVPEDLPSQYWPQLSPRFRPDRGTEHALHAFATVFTKFPNSKAEDNHP